MTAIPTRCGSRSETAPAGMIVSTIIAEKQDARAGSVGIVRTQTVTLFEPPDVLRLESGQTLGPIEVAYETYGHAERGPEQRRADLSRSVGRRTCRRPSQRERPETRLVGHDGGAGQGNRHEQVFRDLLEFPGRVQGDDGASSINPQTGRPWGWTFRSSPSRTW